MKKDLIIYGLSGANLTEKQLNRVADYISTQCDEWETIDHLRGMIEDPNAYYEILIREIRNVWNKDANESRFRRQMKRRRIGQKQMRVSKYYCLGGEFASPLAFMSNDHHNARYALLRGIARYNQGADTLARHMVARHKSWINYDDILTMEFIIEESGMPTEEISRQLEILHKIENLLF